MSELLHKIEIKTPYITLGQMLKLTNEFESGGFIKHYLEETGVLLNGEREHRRGKKLYDNDVIIVEEDNKYIIKQVDHV